MSTITTVQGNFRSNAVQIAADIAGVPLKTNYIQWKDLKSKENMALHPQGQVPSLQTPEGNLTQTNALLTYVALSGQNNLYGSSDLQKAQVDQWLNFSSYELLTAAMPLLLNLWGFAKFSAEELAASLEKTGKLLAYLNDTVLNSQQYFVGQAITIADISIFTVLVYLYRHVFSAEFRAKYPKVLSWYELVSENSSVVKFVGKNRYSAQPW